jgi:predicted TIM-barrel fold metal-dependent hydrolase
MQYRILSSDSHVMEPPDLWSKRIAPEFAEGAPQFVADETADWWYQEGRRVVSMGAGIQAGAKFRPEESEWRFKPYEGRFADVCPGAYEPRARLKDMDQDGIEVEVVYPTVGLPLFRMQGTALTNEVFRCYNDWLAEFCAASPSRLKGIAMINLDEVETGTAELERSAKLGLSGAMIAVSPPPGLSYALPVYEPFWAAAANLGMPLSLHLATERPAASLNPDRSVPLVQATSGSLGELAIRVSLAELAIANLIYAGVFERYPDLKVGVVEHSLAWAAAFIQTMDNDYSSRPWREGRHMFKNEAMPSDFFHRNVFVSFQDDPLGVQLRSIIGLENLAWGSDFPHPDSTFPQSRRILQRNLEGVPDDEVAKIVGENTARWYGIPLG